MSPQLFDDLAADYDAGRPRYPAPLAERLAAGLPADRTLRVLDAAAGTGIVFETLIPVLGDRHDYAAIDISPGMAEIGRRKFPDAHWRVDPVEPVLERLHAELDLITVGQAYHWLERDRFLRAARGALRSGGLLAVLRNDRAHANDRFLSEYEDLLEARNPGYRRDYRAMDVRGELGAVFGEDAVEVLVIRWVQRLTVDDFVRMAASSTQVQGAIRASGPGVRDEIHDLAAEVAVDGLVAVPYDARMTIARRA